MSKTCLLPPSLLTANNKASQFVTLLGTPLTFILKPLPSKAMALRQVRSHFHFLSLDSYPVSDQSLESLCGAGCAQPKSLSTQEYSTKLCFSISSAQIRGQKPESCKQILDTAFPPQSLYRRAPVSHFPQVLGRPGIWCQVQQLAIASLPVYFWRIFDTEFKHLPGVQLGGQLWVI